MTSTTKDKADEKPFYILEKAGWSNRDQSSFDIPPLELPARMVFFCITYKDYSAPRSKMSPGPRPSRGAVFKELRYLLTGDLKRLPDIRYNFLIGPEEVYEGRGWNKQPHLPKLYAAAKFSSLFVAFVGDYRETPPPQIMYHRKEELLKFGVRSGYISAKFLEMNLSQRILLH